MPQFLEQIERHLPLIRPHSADGFIALGLLCVLGVCLAIIFVPLRQRWWVAIGGIVLHGICMLMPVLGALYSVSFFGRMDRMNERMIYVITPSYFLFGCGVILALLVIMWIRDKGRQLDKPGIPRRFDEDVGDDW